MPSWNSQLFHLFTVAVCGLLGIFCRQLHSFGSLSYEMSLASTKASCPQNATKCFVFQFPVPCVFLKDIQ